MLLLTIATIIFGTSMLGLLCWLLIGKSGHWSLKLVTITAVICTSFSIYLLALSYLGEPRYINNMPTEEMLVISFQIFEPSPDVPKGAMYFWVYTKEHDKKPYYIMLPYSRKLHEEVSRGERSGAPLILKMRHNTQKSKDDGDDDEWSPSIDEFQLSPLPPKE